MTAAGDITVTARLFAQARQAAGTSTIDVTLPDGSTADAVWERLPPPVRAVVDPATTRLAINGSWSTGDAPLRDGDEVALITPVSGG